MMAGTHTEIAALIVLDLSLTLNPYGGRDRNIVLYVEYTGIGGGNLYRMLTSLFPDGNCSYSCKKTVGWIDSRRRSDVYFTNIPFLIEQPRSQETTRPNSQVTESQIDKGKGSGNRQKLRDFFDCCDD
jgi:hypothetical protein